MGFAFAASALFAASGDARAAGEPCPDVLGIGDFDQGTTGWLTSRTLAGIDVYLVAAPEDRLGNPSSNAGLVYDQSTIAGADYPIDPVLNVDGTCFGIPPGHVVRVGGWTSIPSGQLRTGTSQLALAWFPSGDCGPLLSAPFAKTQAVVTPGDWTYFEEIFVPPLGADGVSVALLTRKNEAGGVFSSYYDDLYLCMPEPGGAPLGGAAAVAMAGLAGRRRRRRGPPLHGFAGAPAAARASRGRNEPWLANSGSIASVRLQPVSRSIGPPNATLFPSRCATKRATHSKLSHGTKP